MQPFERGTEGIDMGLVINMPMPLPQNLAGAQEMGERLPVSFMSDEVNEQGVSQGGDDTLSFSEAIDSLVNEQITVKPVWTVEGLVVRAVSIFAKPVSKIITSREETVIKTRAAIVAESVRTGLTPNKSIRGRHKLQAAALGAVEKAKTESPDGQIDISGISNDILDQYDITPAEAMKLTERAFGGNEKRVRKVVSVAAVVAILAMAQQVSKPDRADEQQVASSVQAAALPQTTTTKVPETIPTTVAPTTTAPPTTTTPPTAPPIVFSKEQLKLGKRYKFSVNGEPFEQVVEYLRKETGDQWDTATLEAYTGKKPGFIGITAVNNCRDNTVLIRDGEGLMKIATDNNTTMQQIKELMPDGEPRMKAGLCLPIPLK